MKKKITLLFIQMLILAVLLAACGGTGGETSETDVKAGEELFSKSVIGSQAGCSTCHSLQAGTVIVGPSLNGIGSRAGSTVAGKSAEDYLRDSILDPDSHMVEGFPQGTMPQVWGEELTNEQVDQLIAYMLTLK